MTRKMVLAMAALLLLSLCVQAQIEGAVAPDGEKRRPSWAPSRPLHLNTSFAPGLLGLLTSRDSFERSRAAFMLGLIGSRSSLEHIAPLLADPDRTVRVSSGLALGFLGDARGIHVCDAVLKTDPDWMRCYAVYALWYMNTARARLVLDRNGSRQSAFVRGIISSARNTPFKEPEKERQMLSAEGPKLGDVWAGMYEHFIMESDDWFHRGDYDQAIRCQEAALFIDPAYAEAYSLISWLQWSMGDDATAIKTLNRGVKAIPDCPDTWGALGQHYWMTKRYELALEPLRKAIELGGDHTIRRPYAYCLEKTGQLGECLAQWEVLVKECPDDPAAPLNAERIRKKVEEQNLAQ